MAGKRSKLRDPNDTGFILVDWECRITGERGQNMMEVSDFRTWRQAEAAVFDRHHDDHARVLAMRWVWGTMKDG